MKLPAWAFILSAIFGLIAVALGNRISVLQLVATNVAQLFAGLLLLYAASKFKKL